jgi:3D (Asp-Asp-Asp) domain-containing protein
LTIPYYLCYTDAGLIDICFLGREIMKLRPMLISACVVLLGLIASRMVYKVYFAVQSAIVTASEPEVKVVPMKVTAYCLCPRCCGKWANVRTRVTSTGKDARIFDGVAADPKLLPYGTVLDIPGVGKRVVDDTGGAMRQDAKKGIYHIDLRMASHKEACRFGVRVLDVTIISLGLGGSSQ